MAVTVASLEATLDLNKKGFDKGVNEAKGGLTGLLGKLGGVASGAAALGGTAALAGVAAIGAGFVGVGKAAYDTASDMDAATANIAASLGISKEAASEFEDVMLGVFGNNFGQSFDEIGSTIANVNKQLGEMPDADLQKVTERAIALRDTFDTDIDQTINSASVLMDQFGITGSEAMDFIAAGMQRGLDSSGDFLDTIGEYGNLFAQNGMSASEFFSTLETGMAGGALGTDKAADLFKEFSVRIVDDSKTTNAALEALSGPTDDFIAQISSGEKTVGEVFTIMKDRIADLDDPVEQARLGVALFGTQWEDLGTAAVLGIDTALTSMDELGNAADGLDQKYNTIPEAFAGIKRAALADLAPVGTLMVDALNEAIPSIQAAFEQVSAVMMPLISEAVPRLIEIFKQFGNELSETAGPAMEIIVDALNRIGTALGISSGEADGMDMLMGLLDATLWAITKTLDAVVIGVELTAVMFELLARGVEQGRENFDFMKNAVQGAYDWVKKLIDDGVAGWTKFYDALVGIKDIVVDIATNAFGRLGDAMAKIGDTLPDWLIPGSPTPFEMGLKGIKKAIVGMPELSLSAGISPVPGAPAGTTNNYNFGGFSASVNTNQDGGSEAIRLIMQMLQAELAR